MESKTVGKLVRGVIYDDVDLQSIKNGMFDYLHFEDLNNITNYFSNKMHEDTNGEISVEDARLYLNNMNTISALTGYDEEENKTSNLIIPKNALSQGLVSELEKVDLGKNLLQEYADDFFVNYIGATPKVETEVKPEDFCKGEEEELLKYVDKQPLFTIHVDGDTKVDDFKDILSNIIGGISDLLAKEA